MTVIVYLSGGRNEIILAAIAFALTTGAGLWFLLHTFKELVSKEAFSRTVFEASPVALFLTDEQGNVTHINSAFTLSFGYKLEDIPTFEELKRKVFPDPNYRQWVSATNHCHVQAAQGHHSKFEPYEANITCKDGQVRTVLVEVKPFSAPFDGTHMMLLYDITGRKAQQDLLELQVLERTTQLRCMSIELATTEERERQAIARDLHDGLCQTLAIAKLQLSALGPAYQGSSGGGEDSELKQKISAVDTRITEADRAARSLSVQLSPPVLHELGLVPALEWLAEDMRRSYGLRVKVHHEGVRIDLSKGMFYLLFRVARELLINVAKHAQLNDADAAEVAARIVENHLVLSVTDSGVGFSENSKSKPTLKGGFGLFSVRERIMILGGDVQIDSRPGDGTIVVLTVPLATEQ
ncbi:MAG: PAS domain-containing sensor histidine kinase [Sterolibacterium sp.]